MAGELPEDPPVREMLNWMMSTWGMTKSDLARMFQQDSEDLKRLVLQLDLQTVLAQFARAQVNFEDAKTQNVPLVRDRSHRGSPPTLGTGYHAAVTRSNGPTTVAPVDAPPQPFCLSGLAS